MSGEVPEVVDCAALNGITTEPEIVVGHVASNRPNMEFGNDSQGLPHQSQIDEVNFDIQWLDLSRVVIEDKKTKVLARALESNQLTKLEVLFLEGNAGDVGMRAMLNALRAGYLTGLKKFITWEVSSYDQITTAEEGTDTIAGALRAGNLPKLDTMDLTGSLPKLIPARTIPETIKNLLFSCSWGTGRLQEGLQICMGCLFPYNIPSGKNQALECLRCSAGKLQVYSGDDGVRKIGRALRMTPIPSLRILILQQNYIRGKGVCSLAKNLVRDLMPNLEILDLRNNPVSYEGAQEIVHAYLGNPLLIARIRLDWPNSLLSEKAVAFRESNIRLKQRLIALGIERNSIVVDEYIEFEHYLKRPHGVDCFRRHNHRLYLLCHAKDEEGQNDGEGFKNHKVVIGDVEDTKGIELRRRSRKLLGNTSQKNAKNNVRRDLEEGNVDGWLTSEDEEASSDLRVGIEMKARNSDHFSSHVGRKTPDRPSLKRKEAALKRRTGVNRIYITSNTCGFVGAAKALGSQLGRDSRQRLWPWQRKNKTKRQMDTIKEELLMLADRKPDEFFGMFGLRQVLLKNPSNKYSRVWICASCFDGYIKRQTVQPITTNDELNHKGHHLEPKPQPKPTWLQSEVKRLLNRIKARRALLTGCN